MPTEIDDNFVPEEMKWGILKNNLALRPIGDRVVVLEDKFRSGYECKTCGGSGASSVICTLCNGSGLESQERNGEYVLASCRACTIGETGGRRSLGRKPCDACRGAGGTIIVPEENQRRPTTGKVIAIGSEVTEFKPGCHVIYNNYTGTPLDIAGLVIKIMRQNDVMGEIRGYDGEQSIEEVVKSSLINVGIQDHKD